MARIDKVRESYENITVRLFSDKDAFAEYLKFAGKFFKLSSAQSMTIFGSNPNATMVAEYDTWQRFDRQVKRGTSSIAVLNNGGLKHFFDISQTNGSAIPYQWTLDKKTATALIEEIFENDGKRFSSFSGCVNYLGSEMAKENLASVLSSLNIPEENRAGFKKSFISMTQYLIAARCELGGGFKYNGKPDLAALDMLHSKAEKEKFCEFVQLTGKSVLLSLERSINNIIIQGRSNDNGRNQADMVRGGQDVLPRNQGRERQNVQARSGNVRVSGANGAGSDGGRTGSDERGHRAVRGEMAAVYEGEPPRGNTVAGGTAEMGADTPTDRQGGLGVSDAAPQAVREKEPAPDNVRGDSRMGEHSRNDNRPSDNGGHSSSVSGLTEKVDTYINSITRQAEENNSPAFSVAEISLFADKISELSAALTQKYDGNYSELSFANYMANLDGAEYNSDLSERENAVKMLSGGGTHFITDYLKTVYAEAYEGHIIIDEGRSAEQLLSAINSASLSKDKTLEIPDDIDKFYVNREAERVTEVYYNPDSDAGGQLVYNSFSFDQLFEALSKDDPLDYLAQVSRQELVDVGSSDFIAKAREFLTDNEDFNSNDEHFINKLNALVEPTYSIFQIKEGGDLRDYRFADLSELSERGLNVDRENYNRVYRARMKDGETLDDLYTKFNINKPQDFRGHSLSVSDIICIEQNGKTTAHYVDSVGFEEIPDFMLDRDKQITTSVEAFKAKTAANFSPINGFNDADIEDMVRDYVQNILESSDIDAEIVDLAVIGSRSRNLESNNSDLDVAIEFTSDLKEDALFNILHEEPFEIGGVTVDINPIRKEETGTLGAYLENAEKTIFENHERNNLSDEQEINVDEKDLTAYERQYIKPETRENPIHFGLLGNGITAYDTSKTDKETNDYPTVAHISNEGNVEYRADKSTLKTEDVMRIEQQAAQQKQEFTESWNKLPIEERYQKILDGANALPKPQWDVFFADKVRLSEEEAVKKYERSIIFHDGDFPEAARSLTAYRVGDFYEFYGEDAHISSDLLGLTETSRQGKPMTGFPQHAFEENRRKIAMQGYYLKIGDEREMDKILNTNSQPKKTTPPKLLTICASVIWYAVTVLSGVSLV